MINKLKIGFEKINLELICWISCLLFLFFSNPVVDHYSLCIFKFLGIHFCPGCGIGHSISFLLHGELLKSLNTHPLGIFALAIILFRIYQLTNNNLTPNKLWNE